MGGDDELTFGQKAAIRWAGFKKFMYNKEAGTVMGRNGKGWAQLTVFYIIFYACLAAFWAAMLTVFLQTIDPTRPTWNSYVSTPAIAFQPAFKYEVIEYSLPWNNDSKSARQIVAPLDNLYDNILFKDQDSYPNCSDVPDSVDGEQRFCRYDIENLGPECVPPSYGYDEGNPCIFINFNKVWGWIPENYPEGEAPKEAVDNHIVIQCLGKGDSDVEVINQTTYYPAEGISFGHYPYHASTDKDEQNMYISPIVAVQFSFKEFNKRVKIICKPLAGNVEPLKGIYESDKPTEIQFEFTITKKEQ